MIELTVDGMTCSGCVKSVKSALTRTDASAKVEVDLESGRVEIDSALPRATLVKAIEAAGYDVRP